MWSSLNYSENCNYKMPTQWISPHIPANNYLVMDTAARLVGSLFNPITDIFPLQFKYVRGYLFASTPQVSIYLWPSLFATVSRSTTRPENITELGATVDVEIKP